VKSPILLYLVTEDWYFFSHRLPMARAAQRAGYRVHVATRVDRHRAAIEALGFQLHPLGWRRGSLNPLYLAHTVGEVRRLYRSIAPDLVHHVALEPTIVGSLACVGLTVEVLNAVTGLGFAFASRSTKARLLGVALAPFLRYLLSRRRNAVLVQNPDDFAVMQSLGVDADRVFTIGGSGVDVDVLAPLPEPEPPITVGFVGRLLADKGVRTLVAAQKLLAERGRPVRLLLAGDPDPANPASIPSEEIESWKRQKDVRVLGHVPDIRDVWAAAHIAVLTSRREGLPKSLLEAAACARPIVASDVPGCREIARAGVNALLVLPDDPEALAIAIDRLAEDQGLRRRLGEAGRKIVVDEFSSEQIGRQTVALYDRLLGLGGAVLQAGIAAG
jgi:glycosyltransferase involved in cell wall biosynthesis